MKLISMTDFVLQEEKKGLQNTDRYLRFEKILKYAKFLKQPLQLGMFVPCDDEGNVLTGIPFTLKNESNLQTLQRLSAFEKAKEKVLFEHPYNLNYIELIVMDRCKIIEDLLKLNLSSFHLNSNGIKQIGL